MANQALIRVLTMIEMETEATGRVHVRGANCEGVIDFQHRNVVHACTRELSGEAAFLWMMLQEDAEIFWNPEEKIRQVTLKRPVSELMVELMQLEDAAQANLEEILRRYPMEEKNLRPSRDYSGCYLLLEAISPEVDGLSLELNFGSYIVGKAEECAIVVPHPMVSRRHCTLQFDAGSISVVDHASMNGTFVNGRMITESFLESGDTLALGTALFRVTVKIRRLVSVRPDWTEQEVEEAPSMSFKRITKALSEVFAGHA
jgi:hypothetical protein